MTVKERVLEVISKMPDDSTLDDIGYELYVIESVQKGLDELDRGDYLSTPWHKYPHVSKASMRLPAGVW